MTIGSVPEAGNLATSQDDLAKRVKHMVWIVLLVALLLGTIAMTVNLRLGLLATAFILGWSQLVGL